MGVEQDDLVLEYIELAKQSPPYSRGRTSVPCLRGHMFKCLFTAMAVRTDLRARLTKARTLEDMVRCAIQVCSTTRRIDGEEKQRRHHRFGWPHTVAYSVFVGAVLLHVGIHGDLALVLAFPPNVHARNPANVK